MGKVIKHAISLMVLMEVYLWIELSALCSVLLTVCFMVCGMRAKAQVAAVLVMFSRMCGCLDLSLFLWAVMYGR